MDNLINQFGSALDSFANTVQPSNDEFSTSYLYKYRKYKGLKQEERRNDLLSRQKRQRSQNIDASRGILDLITKAEKSEVYKPLEVPIFSGTNRKYANLLMLSEWIMEKPSDLETNWFFMPCPVGKRVVVVHNYKKSSVYNKQGKYLFSFPSSLTCKPSQHKFTILDCIFDKCKNTFYIIDILVWDNYPVMDSSTEFRQYWITAKLDEVTKLTESSFHFYLLEKILYTSDNANKVMGQFPIFENNEPALDGWLFYHKDIIYEPGTTPLVGWLKPFMVNEILGEDITVHSGFMSDRPSDYENQAQYITKFNEMYQRKRKWNKFGKRRSEANVKNDEMVVSETIHFEKMSSDDLESTIILEMDSH